MKKIALVIPYFGRWPEWFDMYLYSCSCNNFITFIFFTDCEIPLKTYKNTIFYATSFEAYCNKASEILGVEFHPSYAYKLVDLKPFLGQIHADLLGDYDFWGYGDVDLIYGDMSIIINEQTLDSYDVFSSHHDRLSGHFTIIRKASQFNELCFRIPNWKNKLQSDCHCGLDEVDLTYLVYPELKWINRWYCYFYKFLGVHEWKFREFVNFIVRATSRRYFKEYKTTMVPKDNERWIYRPKYNKVFGPDLLELPYLHFMFFKKTQYAETDKYWKNGFWQIPSDLDYALANEIVIDNSGIKLGPVVK